MDAARQLTIAVTLCLSTVTISTLSKPAQAQLADRPSLSLEGAHAVMASALDEARRLMAPGGAIAIVDSGGHLLHLERLDGTFDSAPEISIGKARTAAAFKKPTRVFEDLVNKGRTTMVTLPDFTPLMGGVPIVVGERVVGAIGVSGAASAQQDDEIAVAGAGAAEFFGDSITAVSVTFLDRTKVDLAFVQGATLAEVEASPGAPGYKVNASRRDAAGEAEVHHLETDIFYVLEGSATFVTGGTLVEGVTIAPGEIRGPEIAGGRTQTLAKGDFIVVPSGTPHWFSHVDGEFLYYVVKVTT